jgi:hypothetical protein
MASVNRTPSRSPCASCGQKGKHARMPSDWLIGARQLPRLHIRRRPASKGLCLISHLAHSQSTRLSPSATARALRHRCWSRLESARGWQPKPARTKKPPRSGARRLDPHMSSCRKIPCLRSAASCVFCGRPRIGRAAECTQPRVRICQAGRRAAAPPAKLLPSPACSSDRRSPHPFSSQQQERWARRPPSPRLRLQPAKTASGACCRRRVLAGRVKEAPACAAFLAVVSLEPAELTPSSSYHRLT